MQLKMAEILILALTSSLVSAILELNNLAINLDRGVHKSNILYISNALVSAVCGVMLSLTVMLMSNELIVWIIASMIGAFLGKKSFKLTLRILILSLEFFKKADLGKIIQEIDGEKDNGDDNNVDNNVHETIKNKTTTEKKKIKQIK